jgi:hypothetical protein
MGRILAWYNSKTRRYVFTFCEEWPLVGLCSALQFEVNIGFSHEKSKINSQHRLTIKKEPALPVL